MDPCFQFFSSGRVRNFRVAVDFRICFLMEEIETSTTDWFNFFVLTVIQRQALSKCLTHLCLEHLIIIKHTAIPRL